MRAAVAGPLLERQVLRSRRMSYTPRVVNGRISFGQPVGVVGHFHRARGSSPVCMTGSSPSTSGHSNDFFEP